MSDRLLAGVRAALEAYDTATEHAWEGCDYRDAADDLVQKLREAVRGQDGEASDNLTCTPWPEKAGPERVAWLRRAFCFAGHGPSHEGCAECTLGEGSKAA